MAALQIRSLVLALSALILGGFATAPASADEPFKVIFSEYKVKLTGKYTDEWQSRGINHPDPLLNWVFEKGKVTSNFRSGKQWKVGGRQYRGQLPHVGKMPRFQFNLPHMPLLKTDSRPQFRREFNQVPFCGGELGECDGTEPSGLEVETGKCRRRSRSMGVQFRYDSDGHDPELALKFENRGRFTKFCGKKYKSKDFVDRLPNGWLRIPGALEDIRDMNVGEVKTGGGKHVLGYISGDGHPKSPRYFDTCPPMDGVGTNECWTTEFKIEITRVE